MWCARARSTATVAIAVCSRSAAVSTSAASERPRSRSTRPSRRSSAPRASARRWLGDRSFEVGRDGAWRQRARRPRRRGDQHLHAGLGAAWVRPRAAERQRSRRPRRAAPAPRPRVVRGAAADRVEVFVDRGAHERVQEADRAAPSHSKRSARTRASAAAAARSTSRPASAAASRRPSAVGDRATERASATASPDSRLTRRRMPAPTPRRLTDSSGLPGSVSRARASSTASIGLPPVSRCTS